MRLRKKIIYRAPSTMYIARLGKNTAVSDHDNLGYNYGKSKPCDHCAKFLYFYNITKIFYTDIIDGKIMLCELKICR